MDVDAIVASLAAGVDAFELEQRVRATAPEIADLLIVHRDAIARDGARALLQRLRLPVGEVWLEPVLAKPIVGQPIWGHPGGVESMRVEGDRLVTRGADGRLRRFSADGLCHEDRDATERDDARRLGDDLVFLSGTTVRLCDPETGVERRRIELDAGDEYHWISEVRLLDDGTIAKQVAEDDPGSLYGPQYRWYCLDPRSGEERPTSAPDRSVRFANRVAVALADGSVRLVDDPKQLERAAIHERGVLALALTEDRLITGGADGLAIFDRDGNSLGRAGQGQSAMAEIVVGEARIVTCSRYQHSGSLPPPHAWIRDPSSGEPLARVDAGKRYQDFMTCDPTGSRLAYSVDGVLHLRELDSAEAKPLPITWHWNRKLAWSPDGLRLAIQHTNAAPTVWNLETGERERILTTDVLDSARFSISADGELVVVDHSFYALRGIRIADGVALPSLEPGFNVTASASRGGKGVCGGVMGGYWFDFETGKRVQHVEGKWMHACDLRDELAAIAGVGGVVAIERETGRLLWRWDSGEATQQQVAVLGAAVVCCDERGVLTTLVDGEVVRRTELFTSERRDASLCGLADGTLLIGGADGLLRRVDPRTGEQLFAREVGGTAIVHLSAGGDRVCFCRLDGPAQTRTWQLQRLEDGEPLPLPPAARYPKLTPDGRRVVSLDTVARLDVIDARAARVLESRPFGTWPVAAQIEFRGDEVLPSEHARVGAGPLRASIHPGGIIRLWRGEEPVAQWGAPRQWTCVAIDGDRLAAGDSDGMLGLWALRTTQAQS